MKKHNCCSQRSANIKRASIAFARNTHVLNTEHELVQHSTCTAVPEAPDTTHLQTSISARDFQLRMLKPSKRCSVITKEMLLHFLCVWITWIPHNIYFAVLFFVAHLKFLNLSQDEGKAEGWQVCSETHMRGSHCDHHLLFDLNALLKLTVNSLDTQQNFC